MKVIKKQLDVPVLFVAFNRPWTVKKTFEEIRKARPKKLYISVDGPRNEDERKKVEEVKKIVSKIDWACKVKKIFHDENQGIEKAFNGAMEMLFKDEEYGIIIEDDVLASEAFFDYCSQMLKLYKNEDRVMHVSGTNTEGITNIKDNYFFSDTAFNFWGWATWKRAWKHQDLKLKIWPNVRFRFFFHQWKREGLFLALKSQILIQKVYEGKIQTSDYQWAVICGMRNGVCIVPKYNLVTNIGLGKDATHTKEIDPSIPTQRYSSLGVLPKQKIKIYNKYSRVYARFFIKKSFNRLLKKINPFI
jgi:GR25 family glycosyltransferase involved in LPS biosynthesis